jgi:hypothetical protein
MMRHMQAQAAESAQQQPKKTEKAEKPDVEMKYSAKVDVTGEQQKIAGHNAKRMLLTVAMDAAARPEDQKEMQQAGSLVILVDMWNAEDVPHARAMKAFQEAYARKAAREFGSEARGMESLSAAYPGIKEAMEAASKAMKKVPGISVRTVTYIVLVPPDKKFDRELALAGGKAEGEKASEKKPGGLGGALSGMLGQKKKSDAAPDGGEQQAETKQSTIMAVTSELRDVQAGGVPADAFTIPAGYKERKFRE